MNCVQVKNQGRPFRSQRTLSAITCNLCKYKSPPPPPLWRHEYPTWRGCELRSGGNPGNTIPQSAYPRCSPLPTGDWCTQQQLECCTPKQPDYAVREYIMCFAFSVLVPVLGRVLVLGTSPVLQPNDPLMPSMWGREEGGRERKMR